MGSPPRGRAHNAPACIPYILVSHDASLTPYRMLTLRIILDPLQDANLTHHPRPLAQLLVVRYRGVHLSERAIPPL